MAKYELSEGKKKLKLEAHLIVNGFLPSTKVPISCAVVQLAYMHIVSNYQFARYI
jgi:hypothetical protein